MSLTSAGRSLQLLAQLLDTEHPTVLPVDPGPQKPQIKTGKSSRPLPHCTPEQEGISSGHIRRFLQALQAEPTLRMHHLLVVRNGRILCQAPFGAQLSQVPRMTYSACKSITALAVGILMDDGLLQPTDKLVDLFPDAGGPVSRQLMRSITVEHLLSMRTGNQFNEAASATTDQWLDSFFSSGSLDTKKFQYNSLNTYILSVLITRLTGKSLSAFLEERLFAPMGIADYYWETSPEGVEKGGWGLYMRPEDLAKIGQLVMDNGLWLGKQLISAEFLRQATSVHAVVPETCGDYNYGWQIWVGRQENTFLFNGMMGQNVLGFRDSGILLISHAGNDELFQTSRYFQLAAQYFGCSFPQRLPGNLPEEIRLQQTIRSLGPKSGKAASAPAFTVFAGKRFVTKAPRAASTGLLPLILQATECSFSRGLYALSVGGTRTRPELLYEEQDQLHHLICGIKKPIYQELTFHGNVFQVAVQGTFTRDEDDNPVLRIRVDFLETPCCRILKLIQSPKGLILRQEEYPGDHLVTGALETLLHSSMAKSVLGAMIGGDASYVRWRMEQLFSYDLPFEEA